MAFRKSPSLASLSKEQHAAPDRNHRTNQGVDKVDHLVGHPFEIFLPLQGRPQDALDVCGHKGGKDRDWHGLRTYEFDGPAPEQRNKGTADHRCRRALGTDGTLRSGCYPFERCDQEGCLSVGLADFGGKGVGELGGQRGDVPEKVQIRRNAKKGRSPCRCNGARQSGRGRTPDVLRPPPSAPALGDAHLFFFLEFNLRDGRSEKEVQNAGRPPPPSECRPETGG
mmetsp:Transcript_20012/g.41434  ORF Transcript_20012/g.41434 Transcript_20012/m.41434 type:complete len:225 (-) Transcript_20012:376-1050(-)